jgi:CrcB protein
MAKLLPILLIALGGAAGTLARYGVSVGCARLADRWSFPVGTVAVNLLGCFLIGLLNGVFLDRESVRPEVRAALIVGFLGGFTTFSSYAWETAGLLERREALRVVANLLVSNVAGVLLVVLGYAIGRR